ncbi:MAG: hypothetical protein AB7U18_27660, partial [Dehalococcoidia bacterium]
PRLRRRDPAAFRQQMAAAIRQSRAAKHERFYALLPLSVRGDRLAGVKVFESLDVRFQVATWKWVSARLALDDWRTECTLNPRAFPFEQQQFLPLVAEIWGRSNEDAFRRAEAGFDFLRAVLNMSAQFGMITFQNGLPRPLGAVLAPPAYGVFRLDGTLIGAYLNPSTPRRYDAGALSEPQVEWSRQQLRRWKPSAKSGGDIRNIIVDTVSRYGQAMETADWREAFLMLWQALEILTTRQDEPFNMSIVCKRTAALFDNNEMIRDLIEALAGTRNALVHRGRFSANGLRVINVLKWVVEQSVETLDAFSRRARTSDWLWSFYAAAPMQERQLKQQASIVNYLVRHLRRKNA